ncbi:MAG: hypothetical protein ACQETH_03520 [Candidatus Rifleibacteriota bacterium]
MKTRISPKHSKFLVCSSIILLLSIFNHASSSKLNAARQTAIGKVDLKALILLHPSMRSYNPYMQGFKLKADQVTQARAKQQSQEHKSELKQLQTKAKAVEGRITETQRKFNREMELLTNNYLEGIEHLATGPRRLKKKEYDLKKSEKEAEYGARLQSYGVQLLQIEEKIDQLEKASYEPGYTTFEETQKKFNRILNEIRQYTKQIANRKGIEIVLNSKSRDLKFLEKEKSVISPDLNYNKIFKMPFPKAIRNDKPAIQGYYSNLTSMAKNWLHNGSDILQPFSNKVIDNDIFIGGQDLTVEVLKAIFKAYKIDPNIGNAVIQSVLE